MLHAFQPAEHHLGFSVKILIQENLLFSERLALPPRDAGFALARRPLAQKQNIGRDLRVGDLLKRGVRQSNRAHEFALLRHGLA
jgi:hypothetical protein